MTRISILLAFITEDSTKTIKNMLLLFTDDIKLNFYLSEHGFQSKLMEKMNWLSECILSLIELLANKNRHFVTYTKVF